MEYINLMSEFLLKNKENVTFDIFTQRFYSSLRYYNLGYKDNQFDDLLKALYAKDNKSYAEWNKALARIPYFIVKKYTEISTCAIVDDKKDVLKIVYEMYKKEQSIISRTLPVRATLTTVNESKQKILADLKTILLSMENDDEENVVNKTKKEFASFCEKYRDDTDEKKKKYLDSVYVDIYENFGEEIKKIINDEVDKVDCLSARLCGRKLSNNIQYVRKDVDEAFILEKISNMIKM